MLLTRDEFRAAVFTRDGHKCVVCGAPAEDAHHIVERRLWPDGGYYLDNGASLCDALGTGCHMRAEQTIVTCAELRGLAGIKTRLMPDQFYETDTIDKWGNLILPNGQRIRGELFYDESVQKVLSPVLHLFTDRVKHPRMFHLPWSPGFTDDDKVMKDVAAFEGQTVVVTVKMDGEQTTMMKNVVHARSTEPMTPHPSRDRLKALHASIAHDIPLDWRICGENLDAKHSIHYRHLPARFMVFSVWNERNECLSWRETQEWAKLLGLMTVQVIFQGLWNYDLHRNVMAILADGHLGDEAEGYVVRPAGNFPASHHRRVVGKYVRAGHVRDHGHWTRRYEPNIVDET